MLHNGAKWYNFSPPRWSFIAPPLTPGQKRKLDERAEAHIVAIACSDPPEGHTHWTLKLLADKAVELGYVESIARETVRQSLKKRTAAVEEEGVVHP